MLIIKKFDFHTKRYEKIYEGCIENIINFFPIKLRENNISTLVICVRPNNYISLSMNEGEKTEYLIQKRLEYVMKMLDSSY